LQPTPSIPAADRFSVFRLPDLLPFTGGYRGSCSFDARGLPFPPGAAVHPPHRVLKEVPRVLVTCHGVMHDLFTFDFVAENNLGGCGNKYRAVVVWMIGQKSLV
jgi:hypothetical protein